MKTDLVKTLDSLKQPRILVIGDLMLDRYTWGDADRVSAEAPVLVIKTDRMEHRLGGAGNVCNILKGLDAQVEVVGIVGQDSEGRLLEEIFRESGIEILALVSDANRPTTVKERLVGRAAGRHAHQVLRIDREYCVPLSPGQQQDLTDKITRAIARLQAILVCDYGKGVCSPHLIQAVIQLGNKANVPVLVDPYARSDFSQYRGTRLLKPNRLEAERATGISITNRKEALEACRLLIDSVDATSVVITLDQEGIVVVGANGYSGEFPTRPKAVYDITGAGDAVFALLGLSMASGIPLSEAIPLANIGAGIEVEKFGTTSFTRIDLRERILGNSSLSKVLTLEQLQQRLYHHRLQGEKVVFTNGCFDLLHVGHVTYLGECAAAGEVLVVAANDDHSIRQLKGSGRPIIQQESRARMLAALECVDYVTFFSDETPHRLLNELRPDVLAKGGTYNVDEVIGREIVEAYGGTVLITSYIENASTTKLLDRIKRSASDSTDCGIRS